MARKNKGKGKSTVNFSGVETFKKMKDGDHLLTITDESSVEEGDAGPYFKIVATNEDNAKVWHNLSLSKNSLWNAKAFLEACGVEPPEEDTDPDELLSELHEKQFMATIENETYDGKKRPKITDFWAEEGAGSEENDEPDFDEMDEDDLKKFIKKNKLDVDPDDYPKEKKLRAAVKEAYEEGAGEEKEDEPDVDEMDEKQLKKLIKSKDLDVDTDLPLKKLRKAVAKALEDAGEDDEDKPSEDDIKDMDSEGLQEVIDKHELSVDLDDYKTLKKQQKAVIEALAD